MSRHLTGLRVSLKLPFYGWRENSVEHILENRQYTGCTVNGKSTTVSYKVHKVIEKSKEDYQIIPNTQEAKHYHNNVKEDIYFTAVGLFDIPTEQQLIDTMERVNQKNVENSLK